MRRVCASIARLGELGFIGAGPPGKHIIASTDGRLHHLRAVIASLAAFFAACLRPRTPFTKAIVLVLVVKLIAITGIRIYMAGEGAGPAVDASAMARALGVSSANS